MQRTETGPFCQVVKFVSEGRQLIAYHLTSLSGGLVWRARSATKMLFIQPWDTNLYAWYVSHWRPVQTEFSRVTRGYSFLLWEHAKCFLPVAISIELLLDTKLG